MWLLNGPRGVNNTAVGRVLVVVFAALQCRLEKDTMHHRMFVHHHTSDTVSVLLLQKVTL